MSAVALAFHPAAVSILARAIIEPSESPSGLRCPEIKIERAPPRSAFAALYEARLSVLFIDGILKQNKHCAASDL